jgi:hypothetical protein
MTELCKNVALVIGAGLLAVMLITFLAALGSLVFDFWRIILRGMF